MNSEKIYITGGCGYFGSLIYNSLKNHYHNVFSIDVKNGSDIYCDLTNEAEVKNLSKSIRPDVIIHAAGLKDIRICEENPLLAEKINANSTLYISKHFGQSTKIIYISTDYVFDGKKGNYHEHDIPLPSTEYGRTKMMGEKFLLNYAMNSYVIRTSAIYDKNSLFLKYLIDNLRKKSPVDVYVNVRYSPTWINDFIAALIKVIQNSYSDRILHVSGKTVNRYEFAKLLSKIIGAEMHLVQKMINIENQFLMEDLSLNCIKTLSLLHNKQTEHELALAQIFND